MPNKKKKQIMVLGSFDDSNNIGDTATMANLVRDFREELPEVRFVVPLRRRNALSAYDVRPIWSRILFFDPITFLSVFQSDLLIATAGNIFDMNLFNITFNRLFGYAYLFTMAKKLGKKVGLYNTGLGPVTTKLGNTVAKYAVSQADLITLRESQSVSYLHRWNIQCPYVVAADPALNTSLVSDMNRSHTLAKAGIMPDQVNVGFNITKYVEKTFGSMEKGISTDQFIQSISGAAERVVTEMNGFVYFFVSSASDQNITEKVHAEMKYPDHARVITPMLKYSPEEFVTMLSAMNVMVGSRMHSLILSCVAGTPVVGIVYAPKTRNFMCNIGQENRTLELVDLDADRLFTLIREANEQSNEIQKQVAHALAPMKKKARESATLLADLIR